MMKAKKIVALLAGASLCVSMLAGCGSEPASNSSEASDSTQESSAQESGSGEAEDSEESEEEPRQTGSTDSPGVLFLDLSGRRHGRHVCILPFL